MQDWERSANSMYQTGLNKAYQQEVRALGDGEGTISLLTTCIAVLQLLPLVKSSELMG